MKKKTPKTPKGSGLPESKPGPDKECVLDPRAAQNSLSSFKGMERFTLAVMEFSKNCTGQAFREISEGMKPHLDKKVLWQGLELRFGGPV